MAEAMAYSGIAMAKQRTNAQLVELGPRLAFIAPRHPGGIDWPWLSQVGSMRQLRIKPLYIENTYSRFPKATRLYVNWQYLRAACAVRDYDLVFHFSTSIAQGLTRWPARWFKRPRRVYVGFTQDGEWSARKITRLSRALKCFDAITVFSEGERSLYIDRYDLEPDRVHVIPIHTDETEGYEQYAEDRPALVPQEPYVLSLGSPNRRFMPIAKACRSLNIPLVIITRPAHQGDSLTELAQMGATIITNAKKAEALTYLKHARLGVMCFQTPKLPGAFTTLIHAMFLRTPCIVTDCLGMNDYVVNGQTGCITPHGDDDALRSALDALWRSPHTLEQYADCGAKRAEKLFSLEAAALRFSDLAAELLQRQRSPVRA